MLTAFVCTKCDKKLTVDAARYACPTCGIWMAPETRIIAQNSHQSGDTYGVGMALLLNPKCELLFLTSPDDTQCLEKIAFYAGLGIEKSRLGVLVLVVDDLVTEMKTKDFNDLCDIATVFELKVGTKQVKNVTIRAWEPNQLYQVMVNPGLFDRQKNLSQQADKAMLEASYEAALLPYISPKKRAAVSEVGASTRIVAELIGADLRGVIRHVWAAIALAEQEIDSEGHAQKMASSIVKPLLKKAPKGVILLWVRNLNPTELAEVRSALGVGERMLLNKRRQAGLAIDDLFWTLSKKRNPQHLMTPQLFETIRYIAGLIDYAVVPIGDEVLYDEYLAAGSDKKGEVYLGLHETNLIGFWNRDTWFKGPQRRIRQLFVLWRMFHELGQHHIPMVQIGLRSGEMEKAAYLGVPTIYLEEAVSETGSRMLPVTVAGSFTRDVEGELEAAKWWSKALGLRDFVSGKLQNDLVNAQSKKGGNGAQFWENKATELESKIDESKRKLKELKTERSKNQAKQRDAFLFAITDHSAMTSDSKGGLPYFFRLVTKNVIGLYGAGSRTDVSKVLAWLRGKFEIDQQPTSCPPNLLRGTLSEFEIDLLYNTLLNVQVGFDTYIKLIFPRVFFPKFR